MTTMNPWFPILKFNMIIIIIWGEAKIFPTLLSDNHRQLTNTLALSYSVIASNFYNFFTILKIDFYM